MTPSYFSYEVPRRSRWNAFLAGLAIDFAGLLLAIGVASHLTSSVSVRPQLVDTRHHVMLIAPNLKPKMHFAPLTMPSPAVEQEVTVRRPTVTAPDVAEVKPLPRETVPEVQTAKIESPKLDIKVASAALAKSPEVKSSEVKTNVFEAAPSQVATANNPPRQVQTGGFGDPNGVAGTGDPKRAAVTVARLGSFDLPSGPGHGNGSGGSRGVSGTVRSAGFSTVASTSSNRNAGTVVLQGGFGTVVAAGSAAIPQHIQKEPSLQPVEITYKPRPAYTQEARRMGVEGEVVLDVVFTADGSLHIKRVVKGLGYGLDDAALAAAQRIQFRPARRDGQPYDYVSLVHMVFELAD